MLIALRLFRIFSEVTLGLALSLEVGIFGAISAAAQFSDIEQPGIARVRIGNQDFGYFFEHVQWPAGAQGKTVIFVCWEKDAKANFPKEVQWVQSAAVDSWQKHSKIEFRGWEPCAKHNDGIRIIVAESGPRVKAFGKELNDLDEGMELNFTFNSWGQVCKQSESARELCIRSIAVHEFGHALGFAHEQDRADAPGECANVHGTGTTGQDLVQLTPYDERSVMNYCNPAYNNDGKLSLRDIQSVQKKYGSP